MSGSVLTGKEGVREGGQGLLTIRRQTAECWGHAGPGWGLAQASLILTADSRIQAFINWPCCL
jgi:hypothetical protein